MSFFEEFLVMPPVAPDIYPVLCLQEDLQALDVWSKFELIAPSCCEVISICLFKDFQGGRIIRPGRSLGGGGVGGHKICTFKVSLV